MASPVEALYDDDRPLSFQPSINGEVIVRLANHDAVFVLAEDLLAAVRHACDEALAELPAAVGPWRPVDTEEQK